MTAFSLATKPAARWPIRASVGPVGQGLSSLPPVVELVHGGEVYAGDDDGGAAVGGGYGVGDGGDEGVGAGGVPALLDVGVR